MIPNVGVMIKKIIFLCFCTLTVNPLTVNAESANQYEKFFFEKFNAYGIGNSFTEQDQIIISNDTKPPPLLIKSRPGRMLESDQVIEADRFVRDSRMTNNDWLYSDDLLGGCYDAWSLDGTISDVVYNTELYDVYINGIKTSQSTRFLKRPCGALLAEVRDFYNWRLIIKDQLNVRIADINYLSLAAYPTLQYTINEKKRIVNITVSPKRFAPVLVDFTRPFLSVDTPATAIFLNYGFNVNYRHETEEFFTSGNAEFGISGDYGTITSTWVGTYFDNDTDITRLNSQYRLDFPEIASTLRVGDIFTRGEWSASYQLGGIRFGNSYESQPQVSNFPQQNIRFFNNDTANISLEGDRLSVFEDATDSGVIVAPNYDFTPGTYEYVGLPTFGNGSYTLNIQQKDGLTFLHKSPYFYNRELIRAGLNEYSLSLGLSRKSFISERYEDFVASFTNYYGFSNYLTAGVHVDYSNDNWIYGIEAITSIPYVGALRKLVAAGHGESDLTSGSMRYDLELTNVYSDFSYRMFYNYLGEGNLLSVLPDGFSNNSIKHRYGASVSLPLFFNNRQVSVGYSANRERDGGFTDSYTLSSSIYASSGVNLNASYRYQVHPQSNWSAFLTYTMDFEVIRRVLGFAPGSRSRQDGDLFAADGSRISVNVSDSKNGDRSGQLRLSTNAFNDDEDYGLRLSRPLFEDDRYAIGGQYNNRYFTSSVDSVVEDGELLNTAVSFGSGLVLLDNSVYISRSTVSSFAVVKLGEENAGVRVNGYAADGDGDAFLPIIFPFTDNVLAVNSQDLVLNADAGSLEKTVRPGFRKGLIVEFDIKVPISVLVNININQDGQIIALPFGADVQIGGRPDENFPVGNDGLVYLVDVNDQDEILVNYKNFSCSFRLQLPDASKSDGFVELDPVNCI